MKTHTAPAAPLFAVGGGGTLQLMGYLLLALAVMVSDQRAGYLSQFRSGLSVLNEPLMQLAMAPAAALRWSRDAWVERSTLAGEREQLRNELLVAGAQLARLEALRNENERLRQLLGGTRGLNLQVRLAELMDFDLDPFRHRATLNLGGRDGVAVGTALIDAHGVFGQVVEVTPLHATVMLISDPAHAIPVQVKRTGIRTFAYGNGELDSLLIPNIPQSADVREGDELVTSGLGGRFPAGLPVGRLTALRSDDTRLFVVANARPAAQLDRSRELLLVWQEASGAETVGPPRELAQPIEVAAP